MQIRLYIFLLGYFIIGAIITLVINRKSTPHNARENWIKYITYLVVINALFLVIMFFPIGFKYFGYLLITMGAFEITRNMSKAKMWKFGWTVFICFLLISYFFLSFINLSSEYLFYTLFMTVVFDAFSQLSGQLFGKTALVHKISPNKTIEGLYGGVLISLLTSVLIGSLIGLTALPALFVGVGISCFAFLGDLLASMVKRKFNIKDFSNAIPGHGGFLDRFDSLLFAGLFIYLYEFFH